VATTEDLALTVAAADLGNFGAVARAHHVSQSTVSRAVQRVEADVGQLFARTGRTVELLPSASVGATIGELRSVVEQWERLRHRSLSTVPAAQRLSIFCTVTASQTIAPNLLGRFRQAYPAVELDLRTGPASQAFDAARAGEVDAAIAPLPRKTPAGMAVIHLHTTEFVAVTSGPHSWDGARIIVPRSGLTRALVDTWCMASLPGSWNVQETDTHEEAVALAALGFGIALVPGLVFEASPLRKHQLEKVDPPKPLPSLDIGLCALRRAVTVAPLSLLWDL
jgi:LysR family transcriptional regulator, positive regulator for ilvC